jgi:hypothetical protein
MRHATGSAPSPAHHKQAFTKSDEPVRCHWLLSVLQKASRALRIPNPRHLFFAMTGSAATSVGEHKRHTAKGNSYSKIKFNFPVYVINLHFDFDYLLASGDRCYVLQNYKWDKNPVSYEASCNNGSYRRFPMCRVCGEFAGAATRTGRCLG